MNVFAMLLPGLLTWALCAALSMGLAGAVIFGATRIAPGAPVDARWTFGPPAVALGVAGGAGVLLSSLWMGGFSAQVGLMLGALTAAGAGVAFTYVAGIGAAWSPRMRAAAPWLRPAASAAMPMAVAALVLGPVLGVGPTAFKALLGQAFQLQAAQHGGRADGAATPFPLPTVVTFGAAQAAGATHDVAVAGSLLRVPALAGWRVHQSPMRGGAVALSFEPVAGAPAGGPLTHLDLTAWPPTATRAVIDPGCEVDPKNYVGTSGAPTWRSITVTGKPRRGFAIARRGGVLHVVRSCEDGFTMQLAGTGAAPTPGVAAAFDAFAAGIRVERAGGEGRP
jgi:hypothetical protein